MSRTILAAALATVLSCPAAADAIDGDWCGPDGKRLSIEGTEITTPGKATVQGEYNRHEFIYVAPQQDEDAGQKVFLRQLDEEQMHFYHMAGENLSVPELWKRCQIIS